MTDSNGAAKLAPQLARRSDFEKLRTQDVTLPSFEESGIVVRLIRPDVMDLVMTGEDGDAPDPLRQMIFADDDSDDALTTEDLKDPETLSRFMGGLRRIAYATMIDPKLVPEEDDDGTENVIPASWLTLEDLMFIVSFAMGREYNAAARFPGVKGPGVESVPRIDVVGDESGESIRDRPDD